MTLTSHGHHIVGTPLTDEPNPLPPKARCGGFMLCRICMDEGVRATEKKLHDFVEFTGRWFQEGNLTIVEKKTGEWIALVNVDTGDMTVNWVDAKQDQQYRYIQFSGRPLRTEETERAKDTE